TVRALVRATGGELRRARVHDPLLRELDAEWGILGDRTTAVVEMAAASGLPLLKESERDARITSTRGTGELILAAAASGAHRIVGGDVRNVPGAGAAGGLGAGLLAFLDARLISGAKLVLDAVGFERRLAGASLVITGEGRIDRQSLYGKLTQAVTLAARARGVPVVAVAGSLGEGHEAMRDIGVEHIEMLAASPAEREAAIRDPLPRIEAAAERAVRARAKANG